MTFLFIGKWLILNKSYSSCSREFTQGKSYTSKINKRKCQFILRVHRTTLCCTSKAFPRQLEPMDQPRHKPLHSQQAASRGLCTTGDFTEQSALLYRALWGFPSSSLWLLVLDAYSPKSSVVPPHGEFTLVVSGR